MIKKREGIWHVFRMALHSSGIGVWRHDNSPYGLVVMSPSANLPRCVMPFWTHAHVFSLYDQQPSTCSRCQHCERNGTICWQNVCPRAAAHVLQLAHLRNKIFRYSDVIMDEIAYQVTSFTIVYSTVYSGAYQRKHQSSASLALVRGIHRWPVKSPHKWSVTRQMFDNDDDESMFIVKVVQKSNRNNQQCKDMIHHKKLSSGKA